MQLKDSKKPKIIVIITVIVLFLLSGGALAYWFSVVRPQSNFVEEEIITTNDSGESPDKVDGENPQPATDNDNYEKTVTVPSESTDGTVTPVITFAQENAGFVSLGSFFNSPTSGSCELTLSKAGEVNIVKTTPVQLQSQYICQFWDVAVPSSGGWTAKLVNINGSSRSTAAEMGVE
jgi:hypothetical protein